MKEKGLRGETNVNLVGIHTKKQMEWHPRATYIYDIQCTSVQFHAITELHWLDCVNRSATG